MLIHLVYASFKLMIVLMSQYCGSFLRCFPLRRGSRLMASYLDVVLRFILDIWNSAFSVLCFGTWYYILSRHTRQYGYYGSVGVVILQFFYTQ